MNSILTLAYLFTVGNGLLLSVLFFLRRGKAVKLSGLIILCCTLEIFMQYLWHSVMNFPGIYFLHAFRNGACFLYGPLIYLYFRAIDKKPCKMNITSVLHFVPFVCVFACGITGFAKPVIELFSLPHITAEAVFYVSVFISAFSYIMASVFSGNTKQRENANDEDSCLLLKWKRTWSAYSVFAFAISVFSFAVYISGSELIFSNAHILCACLSVPVYFNGYASIADNNKFALFHGEKMKDEESNIRYSKNKLSESKTEFVMLKILDYLDGGKAYLDPEMTIEKFSNHIKIHPHHVSQVINSRLSVNYHTLIASRRVENAKSALHQSGNCSRNILSIAFDSGFNSKNAFNSAFKKMTGMTPSQYRHRLHKH